MYQPHDITNPDSIPPSDGHWLLVALPADFAPLGQHWIFFQDGH